MDATLQSARLEKARAALAAVQLRVGTSRSATGAECWDAPTLPLAPGQVSCGPSSDRWCWTQPNVVQFEWFHQPLL